MLSTELACDVTVYMDKFRDPEQMPKDKVHLEWMRTYIMSRDGKPEIGHYDSDPEYAEKFYFWWVRIPGYTCANIVFNKSDDTVAKIVLTRRGGGFAGGQETMYLNPDKLEKELNKMFVGKTLKYWSFDDEKNQKENKDE